jgi:O-antigen/teichoic acid export membrane protein
MAGVENGAQLLRAILLARILAPSDFGLMGMAFVVIYTGESLSQTGFYRALVQTRGDAAAYLDTVFVISALRGALLSALMWGIAPLVGAFFATPAAVPIVRAAGLLFVIQGLLNPALFLLERELAFGRYALPRMVGVLVDLAVSVAAALELRSVWGMVWGFLAGKVVYVVFSYAVRPYRPALRVRKDQALEFYRYGRHVFRAAAVDCLVTQADKALVGRLLGVEALGLYAFAARLASLPSTGLYDVVFRIAFPLFSKVQGDRERLRAGYLRGLGLMAALAAPLAAGLFIVAPDLVAVVFGAKWGGMVPALAVLCLGTLFSALHLLIRAILGGVGRPDAAARGAYVLLAAMVLPLYPAVSLGGTVGAAWCVSAASAAAFAYLIVAGSRACGCGVGAGLRAAAAPILGAGLMGAALWAGRSWLGAAPSWSSLAAQAAAGAVLYPAATFAFDRALSGGLVPSLISAWRSA